MEYKKKDCVTFGPYLSSWGQDSYRAFGFRAVLNILWLFDKLLACEAGLCSIEIESLLRILWLFDELLASQAGLCSVETERL